MLRILPSIQRSAFLADSMPVSTKSESERLTPPAGLNNKNIYETKYHSLAFSPCRAGLNVKPLVILITRSMRLELLWQFLVFYCKVTSFVRVWYPFSYFWLETGPYELIFVLSKVSKKKKKRRKSTASKHKEIFIRFKIEYIFQKYESTNISTVRKFVTLQYLWKQPRLSRENDVHDQFKFDSTPVFFSFFFFFVLADNQSIKCSKTCQNYHPHPPGTKENGLCEQVVAICSAVSV